jgi:predicted nucleic acid-binding protein
MSFVVDNSAVTGWRTISQANAYSDAVLASARETPPHAPALWVLEFANVLRRARLEKALTDTDTVSILDDIAVCG